MGAVCGTPMTPEMKEAIARSRALERVAKKHQQNEESKIKLLLLGAGESGKSTIFKQMKILHGGSGYTKEERIATKAFIYNNVFVNMKTVLEHTEKYGKVVDNKAEEKLLSICGEFVESCSAVITPEVAEIVKRLWADPGFQKTWHERAKYQVQDALKYYVEKIDEIANPDYIPTDADILRSRVRTTGIQEETYIIDETTFVIFDVGGQRNERKKWIHCFDQVHAVIYVAAISEYDQVLYEDNSKNRVEEALELFGEICNSKWFEKTSMILFLNKRDLFAEKLPIFPFKVPGRYDDFPGPCCVPGTPSSIPGTPEFQECYRAASTYLHDKFIEQNRQRNKTIYSHITCATDTSNVQVVFNSCKDIMLQKNIGNLF